MTDTAFHILTGTGVVAIVAGAILLKKNVGDAGDTSPATDKNGLERKLLADASDHWTEKQIPLATVCTIWVPDAETARITRPTFSYDDITKFWIDVVEKIQYLPLAKQAAIVTLLQKLDLSGNCPSVVRNPKHKTEVENAYSDDMFTLLSSVTLREHTLRVAEHMARRTSRDILVPDGIIVALGHDLGKIPAYHDKGYSTGDHPIISELVLAGLPEIMALSNHQELCGIVKSHHYERPHNAFAVLLKQCDQISRNEETASRWNRAVAARQGKDTEPSASVTAAIPATELPQPDKPHQSAYVSCEQVDIAWFDPDQLLATMKPDINQIKGSRWVAASTPNGLVYINADYVWSRLNKIAGDSAAELKALEASQTGKRNIIYSAVKKLDDDRQAVAIELLRPGNFLVPVTIIDGSNNTREGIPMIPFRAEAFGLLPSELEASKSPAFRRMVKSISHYPHEENNRA